MRRLFVLSLLMLLAPFVTAQADPINLGYISFDTIIPSDIGTPGVNGFTIANLTGDPDDGGFALPGDFPVFDPILFANSRMTVVMDGSSTDYLLGDIGPGIFLPDILQFLSSGQISSATFSAVIGPLVFSLSDGTTYAASSGVLTATLLPTSGSYLSPGQELAVLTIDATQQTSVPEPHTWLLLGSGLAIFTGCRRRLRNR